MSWWRDAVIYQVYPRSFRDSNADGVGDLRGIEMGLDHIAGLGAAALWMSPIHPSPLADFGYDVADYLAVDPSYGTLEDFDRLVASAHARGLKLLMDLVPSHTSNQHPWFTERPDFYIWADGEGDRPPNNWVAAFGGPAWTRDERGAHCARARAVVDRDPGGPVLRADPGGMDHVAVPQDAGPGGRQEVLLRDLLREL